MFNMQQMISSDMLQSLILYDFNAENSVLDCAYDQTIKAYLMKIKARDRGIMFPAVEFVKRVGKTERGSIYFEPKYETEVMTLLNCNNFWNSIKICKPTLQRKTMFNTLPKNAVEISNEWNYMERTVEEELSDMTKEKPLQGFTRTGAPGLTKDLSGNYPTIMNGDWPMIVGGIDHRVKSNKSEVKVTYSEARKRASKNGGVSELVAKSQATFKKEV